MSLAEILFLLGRAEEAHPVATAAVAVAERKGSVAGARTARALPERLAATASLS
jgi:hypothetical protein